MECWSCDIIGRKKLGSSRFRKGRVFIQRHLAQNYSEYVWSCATRTAVAYNTLNELWDSFICGSHRWKLRETLNGQRLIEFRLGQEAESEQGLSVAAAELMVRAEATPRARKLRYTLWAFTVHGNSSVGELAGEAEIGGGRTGSGRGWQRVDVTPAARRWAAAGATTPLRLLVDCSGCAGRVRLRLGGAAAARPLLRLRVAARSPRRRRALDCDAAAHGRCCRQTYYVSFRALGWDDWIVAPEGYYANYCRGACEPYLNYHSQVVEAARLQRAACCAPVRFSALSLIYFGADSNIIKRDLPEMVVEECDCP
ncbi:inhibin beta chain [Danaus plexippus]|uniref:inhibin beta chain n=1 Tax=Danaus plexippus TaxID=13037 RepID=UPI002AB04F4E|nr:inhibin beta chain [Danaus plexippus]